MDNTSFDSPGASNAEEKEEHQQEGEEIPAWKQKKKKKKEITFNPQGKDDS